jgi:hypothetical protein
MTCMHPIFNTQPSMCTHTQLCLSFSLSVRFFSSPSFTHTYTYIHTYMYTYTHTHNQVHTHTHTHARTHREAHGTQPAPPPLLDPLGQSHVRRAEVPTAQIPPLTPLLLSIESVEVAVVVGQSGEACRLSQVGLIRLCLLACRTE